MEDEEPPAAFFPEAAGEAVCRIYAVCGLQFSRQLPEIQEILLVCSPTEKDLRFLTSSSG